MLLTRYTRYTLRDITLKNTGGIHSYKLYMWSVYVYVLCEINKVKS